MPDHAHAAMLITKSVGKEAPYPTEVYNSGACRCESEEGTVQLD